MNRTAGAQDQREALERAATQFVALAQQQWVRVVGPSHAEFDPQTKIVKVKLFNPAADTAQITLDLSFQIPPTRRRVSPDDLLDPETRQAADSALRASLRIDSLEREWSLRPWIKEPFPVKIWLAPHQTVTLTLHLDVPPSLKPGTYTAYLLVLNQSWMMYKIGFSPFSVSDDALPPVAVELRFTMSGSPTDRAAAAAQAPR